MSVSCTELYAKVKVRFSFYGTFEKCLDLLRDMALFLKPYLTRQVLFLMTVRQKEEPLELKRKRREGPEITEVKVKCTCTNKQ